MSVEGTTILGEVETYMITGGWVSLSYMCAEGLLVGFEEWDAFISLVKEVDEVIKERA